MSKFKFAIMGAANIAEKFCDAVSKTDSCEVIAVSGKTEARLKEFSEKMGIPKYYVGYENMLKNEKPDCVYIATVTSLHYELTMLCIKYGIPVLCEKAMFRNSEEASTCLSYAKEKGVFVMEAMWSRFLPAIKKAKEWADSGKIGKIGFVKADLGWTAQVNPNNRFYSKALGGGAAYDLLVYSYELSTYILGDGFKDMSVQAVWSDTGVDISENVTLRYDSAIASLGASLSCMVEERLVISGDRGLIIVPKIHFASEAFLYDSSRNEIEHFVDDITPNGFIYEVLEAAECVKSGKLESETVPHSTTLGCAKMFDELLKTEEG